MASQGLLIVGAGPSGLALSMRYKGPSRVLEKSGEVGGLCRTVEFGGGVFDLGGHSFHSPHPEVIDLVEDLMAGRWSRQRRDARVFFQERLIDYPFQSHIDQIADPAVVAECRASPPDPVAARAAGNLEDWLLARFGAGACRHFLLPYNRKLWATDPRRISRRWVGERIAGAEAGETPGPARRPLRSGEEVGYPAEGGFAEIFKAMAGRCGPIAFGQDVRRIDPAARTARTAGGEVWEWDTLVSTMPAPMLMRAIEGCPEPLIAAADRLEAVSLKIVMALVAGPVGGLPQRLYVADPDMPAHKIAFNHTSSPSLRARPVHAIMAETAYSPAKPAPPDGELARASLDWLARGGFIASPDAVLETRIVDLPHGYPLQTHERAAIMDSLRAWLAPRRIHTIGRFGGWDYVNSDACLMDAMTLAQRLGAA
jgi:UDP-galactopyranose mutase